MLVLANAFISIAQLGGSVEDIWFLVISWKEAFACMERNLLDREQRILGGTTADEDLLVSIHLALTYLVPSPWIADIVVDEER